MVPTALRPPGAAVALVSLGLLLAAPVYTTAQERPGSVGLRRIQDVTPLSGPPGTRVLIHTENMPLQAKIHVGVGATRFGFEQRGEAAQGEWGVIDGSTTIPETATWDRPVFVILFNAIFSPIGISEPFHVTDAEGRVRRVGAVVRPGRSCAEIRDADGHMYQLRGDVGSVEAGDTLVVEGTFEGVLEEAGGCPGGATILVDRVSKRPPGVSPTGPTGPTRLIRPEPRTR